MSDLMAGLNIQVLTGVRTRVRQLQAQGMDNPYDMRDIIFREIPESDYADLVYELLASTVRETIRQQRQIFRKKERKAAGDTLDENSTARNSVHIPGLGWKNEEDLNAEECDALASYYEQKAEENLELASYYRDLAQGLRINKFSNVKAYRDWCKERTQEAIDDLKYDGVRLGRPRRTPDEVIERAVIERNRGLSYRKIAEGFNRDGIPTTNGGKQWYPATVRGLMQTLKLDQETAAARKARKVDA